MGHGPIIQAMKKKIHIDNYEAYAMDYVEGLLDVATHGEMEAFLLLHPSIAKQIEALDTYVVEAQAADTLEQAHKQGLYYDTMLEKQAVGYGLLPDESLRYPHKAQLKKRRRSVVLWWVGSAAAAAVLMLLMLWPTVSSQRIVCAMEALPSQAVSPLALPAYSLPTYKHWVAVPVANRPICQPRQPNTQQPYVAQRIQMVSLASHSASSIVNEGAQDYKWRNELYLIYAYQARRQQLHTLSIQQKKRSALAIVSSFFWRYTKRQVKQIPKQIWADSRQMLTAKEGKDGQ